MKSKACITCNKQLELIHYHKRSDSKDGHANECKNCTSIRNKKWKEENQKKVKETRLSATSRYHCVVSRCKRTGVPLNLTLEQYKKFIDANLNCYYCDISMENSTGSGLNRVNSSKGYCLSNIQRCCGTCNTIMSNFTKEELQSRVYKIIKRMK